VAGPALFPADTASPLDVRSIGAVLAHQARVRGEAIALCWLAEDGTLSTLTYRALHAMAARLAAEFIAEYPAGSRIAVWSPNTPSWVVVLYATALAGAVLTPINPALTDDEVRPLLEQSDPSVIYAGAPYRSSPLLDRAHHLANEVGIPVRALASIMDPAGGLSAQPSAALPNVDSGSPFLLQYTSGTTGRPKGVVLTHFAAFNSGRLSAERLGLAHRDVWLCPLPLHHVGGSVCIVLPMLAAGGTVALASGWDVEQAVRLVSASQSTVIGVVPTMMIDLAAHPGAADGRLASIRIMQGGGSTVAPALIRRVQDTLGASVVVAYGQSEAPVSIAGRQTDSAQEKATTIGSPLAHRDVRIADPETGDTLEIGDVGELQIRSPLSMTGYWRNPEATAAAIDGDGWLHTGDLCSMDEMGMLRIHGRHRDLIIRGGENIYPGEVEAVLLRHAGVSDVAVVGAASERWGEEPVAFVLPVDGVTLDEGELDSWTKKHLAGFKRPRHWYFVDSFPLTASGKVQKFVLRERLKGPDQTR
jgi:fatty-acyl-CoA synthase